MRNKKDIKKEAILRAELEKYKTLAERATTAAEALLIERDQALDQFYASREALMQFQSEAQRMFDSEKAKLKKEIERMDKLSHEWQEKFSEAMEAADALSEALHSIAAFHLIDEDLLKLSETERNDTIIAREALSEYQNFKTRKK